MPTHHSIAALLAIALIGCSSQEASTAASSATNVVFNEISAAGTEWLELYNKGDSTFDLSSYALADTDKTTGNARTSKAMRFPTGTKLPKAGFLLVLMGKNNSTPGPYSADACLSGVSVGCYYGVFSLSESRGEAVHLLAPDNSTLVSTTYPADLGFEAGSGMTACRLPDGTGDLTTCAATPGASNAAP
jgi:Lamin Tail Domain